MGNLKDAYTIVCDPRKLLKGMISRSRRGRQGGHHPEQWLIGYFGGPDGMPILRDTVSENFRKAMLADKPALDETLRTDDHGLLTHIFQESVLAEEADVLPGADALFDSLDQAGTINRLEHLGPILTKYLRLPGRLPRP